MPNFDYNKLPPVGNSIPIDPLTSPQLPAPPPLPRMIDKLKSKVLQFFGTAKQPEPISPHVTHRIQELHDANDLFLQLTKLKEELREALDLELFSCVEAIIDPILQRIQRIANPKKQEEDTTIEDTKQLTPSAWIKNAKSLAHFFSTHSYDRNKILRTVIKHAIQTSIDQFDEDLRLVHDYRKYHHSLHNLDMQMRHFIDPKLDKVLSSSQEHLELLKIKAKDTLKRLSSSELSVDQLQIWKANIDAQRTEWFELALEDIDRTIQIHISVPTVLELLPNLEQMTYLEKKVSQLWKEINSVEELDDAAERSARFTELEVTTAIMADQTEQLFQSLQPSPSSDLYDRLSTIRTNLLQVQERMLHER